MEQRVCVRCGKASKGGWYSKSGYCQHCAEIILSQQKLAANISSKNWSLILILAICLGPFGVHRFYAGKIKSGILWLFTGGCFMIGWIYDITSICMQTFKDGKGLIILPESRNLEAQAISSMSGPSVSKSVTIEQSADEISTTNGDDDLLVSISSIELCPISTYDDVKIKKLKKYYVLDVETTGLNRKEDKIIELGILQVENGIITNTFTSFVNPEMPIPRSASAVNHIYDQDVCSAPKYSEIASQIGNMLLGQVVVGHNISFDLAFIKRMLKEAHFDGTIYSVDTVSYSKRAIKGLENYKLHTISQYLGIQNEQAHRALADAKATQKIFEICRAEIEKEKEKERLLKAEKRKIEKQERQRKYGNSPLFNISFVFTGDFEEDRANTEDAILALGGYVRGSVSSKTDYLVVGNIEDLPEWAKERKFGAAKNIQEQGGKVAIIDEQTCLNMIKHAKEAIMNT